MQAFRSANEDLCREGKPYLPEELLLQIHSYIKAVGDHTGALLKSPGLSDHVGNVATIKLTESLSFVRS